MIKAHVAGWAVLSAAALGIGYTAWMQRAVGPALETQGFTHPSPDAPAMCPWRIPSADMHAFFHGSDQYRTQTLVLSGLRVPIKQRLGSGEFQDTNALYVYRVRRHGLTVGTVLVQRAAGEYGALEVVTGVTPEGRVAGVRLQRFREPVPISSVIASPRWLGAFRGETASSEFKLGADIPGVPPEARPTADVIARTVRTLLIELDVADRRLPKK